MRMLPLLVLTAALVLSGCAGEEDPDAGNGLEGGPGLGNVTIPDDVVFSGNLHGIGPPTAPPAGTVPACPLASQQCVDHVVTVPAGTWNVTFTLVGSNGMVTGTGQPSGTDYDLFVEGVGDSTNPSGQTDVVRSKLGAGDYTAQVLAWHDVDGEYTLTVTFAV